MNAWIERSQGKQEQPKENQRPFERVAAKVVAALKGDERAREELNWKNGQNRSHR